MNEEKRLPAENFRGLAAVVIDLTIISIFLYIYVQTLILLNLEFIMAVTFFPLIFIGIPIYYGLCFSKQGQSLGYKFLKIKVITKDGSNPTFWQSFSLAFSKFNTDKDTQALTSDYGYGNSVENAYNITTIKLGESKWKTIISCGCLTPILFIIIVVLAIFVNDQLIVKREQGMYKNLRGNNQ
jgi:hypothetical protein